MKLNVALGIVVGMIAVISGVSCNEFGPILPDDMSSFGMNMSRYHIVQLTIDNCTSGVCVTETRINYICEMGNGYKLYYVLNVTTGHVDRVLSKKAIDELM